MKRASDIFSDADRQRINAAVSEAESKTSAEIMPAVAGASGRYDRAEDIVGLWLGGAAALVTWWLLGDLAEQRGSWGDTSPAVKALAMVAALAGGFIVGALMASRVGWLRRLFTPAAEMHDDVLVRARSVFFDQRVHRTAGATGLVVYVSLYERMAAVVADDAVIETLGNAALDDLRNTLTTALRQGPVTDALCATLAAAGERLGAVLPRADDDVNELPDALVTLD